MKTFNLVTFFFLFLLISREHCANILAIHIILVFFLDDIHAWDWTTRWTWNLWLPLCNLLTSRNQKLSEMISQVVCWIFVDICCHSWKQIWAYIAHTVLVMISIGSIISYQQSHSTLLSNGIMYEHNHMVCSHPIE